MLIIIDLQKAIDDPSWGIRNNPDAEIKIGELLKHWRELDLPLLHVKHMSTEPNSKYAPDTPTNAFKAVVEPRESEQVLEKSANSAFIRTDLDAMLQQRGITELILVGVITNNSVEATARMAGNLGYDTIVVSDATYTFNLVDYGGVAHSAEVVHNMALANLDGEYAQIFIATELIDATSKLSL